MALKGIVAAVFLLAIFGMLIYPVHSASGSVFCSVFENNQHLVTNAFNLSSGNSAWWENILAFSVLTILMVFAVLSVAYAIGMAFGINKLVMFCRSEFAESVFTLAIIAMVGGSTAYLGRSILFMSSIANIGISGSTQTPQSAHN